ncbi:MAG: tRNA (N6-threonylcarbamoyladenosine(37)-N6)-methyltransferase TrmO [Marinilabiliaceae bacterium]|nr:tRNA (N6-threonylcarbamoyladenosine(37)-N6)-methyltransferase TrmO [Marinilabiliaceae bacterium]
MCPICYTPIGVIHTPFHEPQGMPIQPSAPGSGSGFVEVFEDYATGLNHIEGFSHLILLYHFHRAPDAQLQVTPFMDDHPHGIFATRSPTRPNAIGMSIVRLIDRIDNRLYVDQLDMLDKTPLIDIKPFFEPYDNRTNTRQGWLNTRKTIENTRADGRFA